MLACAPSHSPRLQMGVKWQRLLPFGRTPMPRSTPDIQPERKWALALRREMQMAIRQQLRTEYELPQELTALPTRSDKEHDPYADIVGTC
jgi:hypothetical protein